MSIDGDEYNEIHFYGLNLNYRQKFNKIEKKNKKLTKQEIKL